MVNSWFHITRVLLQPIRKGWVLLDGSKLGRRKERWFVLGSETLSWYKDEEVC